jgi:hypothetical protein
MSGYNHWFFSEIFLILKWLYHNQRKPILNFFNEHKCHTSHGLKDVAQLI